MNAEIVRVESIPFHGDSIVINADAGPDEAAIAFSPSCEAIGLPYDAQLRRLKRHKWSVAVIMTATAKDGKNYPTTFVTRKTFVMWLAGIDTSRLADPAIRAKIELYQAEAAETLDRHFFGKQSTAPATVIPSSGSLLAMAKMLVASLERQDATDAKVESVVGRVVALERRIHTHAEKRAVVLMYMKDHADWPEWSDRHIAARCLEDFGCEVRAGLVATMSDERGVIRPDRRKYWNRHGQTCFMDVSKIKATAKARKPAPLALMPPDPIPQPTAPVFVALGPYCGKFGPKLSRKELAAAGRWLSNHCRVNGIATHEVPDEHYVSVKTYPMDLLDWWRKERPDLKF